MDTTGEATATASPTAAPTVSATTDMAGIYQDDTIHVTFSDYHLYDSYPKDTNSIKLNAQKGNKLIVIAFHIKNNTDKEQKINFMKDKIKYQLHIDNDMVYTPAITPLSNDIQYIETTIQPHKTKKALLVFEIIDQSRFNSIQLSLTKADQTAVINLN
jgi:Telomeric repeat-binding factor 2.